MDHQAYEGLDVVTLKGTLVSHKGVHPTSIGYQAGTYKLDKTRLFEYDDSRKIHVYGSYGNDKDLISSKAKLVYDFNLKNTGMLSIRFKPVDVGTQLRTILSLQIGTETPLGLYVNSVNKLVLTQDQLETLNNTIITNGWNQLVIRWNQTNLWIYLNGDTVVSRTKSLSYENALVSVGALINSSVPSYHFNGQFEMLAHSDQIFDDAKVTLIRNSYQTIAYESEYDVLGRKEKDELSIGTTKRTADYTYKRPNGDTTKTSFEVEHIKTLANQNIYYNYDALGNVTEMDTPEGTYEYKYDFMGRLIEEYNPVLNQTIKMEYDKQNMIFKRYYAGKTLTMVKQIEFLTNAEDQLVYVGTVEGGNETPLDISYDPKYLGNPTEIGSKELVWEGRRLKQILDGDDVFNYTYNEQGLRTKKNINDVETKYYLQGSNIIAEEKNGQTIHYIYNEQNQLVGFEHQQSKYFYVRDLLGVIRNVIDINGSIVVTYKYDAWGNHKVYDSSNAENTSSSFIGNINPFRYKGYYYDVETDWYYQQSRYYCPLIGKFIDLEDISSLKPRSIVGVLNSAISNSNPIKVKNETVTFNLNGKSQALTSRSAGLNDASINFLGKNTSKSSNAPLSFSVGLVTPKNYSMPDWMSTHAFYIKGSLGWGYTVGEGYSIASLSIGVIDSTFHTPKWFSSLSSDHLANPNVYLGIGAWNANASLGAGISGTAEIISGTIGVQFGDSVSIGVKGYVGAGFSFDFSNGFKFGAGLGLGYEVSITIDWNNLFK